MIVLMSKVLPKTKMWSVMALTKEENVDDGYVSPSENVEKLSEAQKGTAFTTLRPSGKATFGDNIYDVITEDSFIEKGSPIIIVAIKEHRIIVEKDKT